LTQGVNREEDRCIGSNEITVAASGAVLGSRLLSHAILRKT
jgi:hypothetical protein